MLSDGEVIVGGSFAMAGSITVNSIARRNVVTGVWSAYGSGVSGGEVRAITTASDGDVIAGGTFTMAGGVPANSIARWDTQTQTWSALGSGIAGSVNAIAITPNGDIYAGGDFDSAGGNGANNIARWDGTSWSALGLSVNAPVYALVVMPDGTLIAGGRFDYAGQIQTGMVARWNGSVWSRLGPSRVGFGNVGQLPTVYAMTVLSNGDLVIGGGFISPGGNLARWNGSTWSGWPGGGATYGVGSLTALPSGGLVAGVGLFPAAGGVQINRIAYWNGSAWLAMGSGIGGISAVVHALAPVPRLGGVEVVVGGSRITTVGGTPANNFARYSFGPSAPSITAHPQSILVCRNTPVIFNVVATGTDPIAYIWRHDGVPIDAGVNPTAATSTLSLSHPDAGSYDCVLSNTCGEVTCNPASITFSSDCEADFNCNSAADSDDFFTFIEAFFRNLPRADFHYDGRVDSQDFFAFLAAFFAGC